MARGKKFFLQASREFLESKTVRSIEVRLGANIVLKYLYMLLDAASNEIEEEEGEEGVPPHLIYAHDEDKFSDELAVLYNIEPETAEALIQLLERHQKAFWAGDKWFLEDAVECTISKTDAAIKQKRYRDKKREAASNSGDGQGNKRYEDDNECHTSNQSTNQLTNQSTHKEEYGTNEQRNSIIEQAWFVCVDIIKGSFFHYPSDRLDVNIARTMFFKDVNTVKCLSNDDILPYGERIGRAVVKYLDKYLESHEDEDYSRVLKLSNLINPDNGYLDDYLDKEESPYDYWE